MPVLRFLRWQSGKESICHCRRRGFDPYIGKVPWRKKCQYSSILAWKIPWTENWRTTVHGVAKIWTQHACMRMPVLFHK